MPEITATFFEHVRDKFAKPVQLTFAELAEMMEDASAIEMHRADKESAWCVIPAHFAPQRRARANVVERFAFTGDVDGDMPGDPGFDGLVTRLNDLGLAHIVHTTTKSTVTQNKYRVILPFSAPLSADDSEAAWSSINQMFGSIFDPATFDASRLSVMPRAWFGDPEHPDFPNWNEADAHHRFSYRDGDPVVAEAIMAAFPPVLAPRCDEDNGEALAAILSRAAVKVDFADLTDLDRSPLVTPDMVTDYLFASPGGRFFRFMCRVSGRALTLGVNCDEDIILALGMAMNRRADNRRRPLALREARRALRYAASRHGMQPDFKPQTREDILNREIERLRRRKG